MTAARSTTLRTDLGGAQLLERRVLVLIAPPAMLASVLTRDPSGVRETIAWCVVNLAALTMTWLWLELMRSTVARHRATRPVGPLTVVAIGASIGLVKAVATSGFAWTARLLPELLPASEWIRALGPVLQGAILLPALTLTAATLARYRAEYRRLVAERARLALLDATVRDGGDEARRHLIAGFVTEARRRLSGSDERAVAAVLERLVDERLRPMTRSLWTPPEVDTDFSTRSLLRAALLANPLPTLFVAVGYGLTAGAARLQDSTPVTAAARTLLSVVAIWAMFSLARRWRCRQPRLAVLHLALTLLAVTAVEAVAIELLFTDLSLSEATTRSLVVLALMTTLTLAGGATSVATRDSDRVRAELSRVLDRVIDEDGQGGADIGRASRLLRDREVADHLHSSLQNRLTSAARRISASGESAAVVREELDAIDLLLDDLATGIEGHTLSGATASSSSARMQLAEVIARWDGFVTVTTALDARLDALTPRLQDRIAQVIVEALNNAVRHGHAASVTVRLAAGTHDGVLALTVDDDGVGPVVRDAGLGSALFTAMTGGDWRLEPRTEGGSRLELMLQVG